MKRLICNLFAVLLGLVPISFFMAFIALSDQTLSAEKFIEVWVIVYFLAAATGCAFVFRTEAKS